MTEPAFLAPIRESYDTVADAYLKHVKDLSALGTLSRAMLAAFADLVREGDRGPVADVGCGPGVVTDHLAAMGVPIFGIDLSPKMIELAQQGFPHLRFEVGSMTALPLGNDVLGGILAFYSTHHTPPEHLPLVYGEFYRTLAPGGHLMIGTHLGDHEVRRPTEAYGGHPVSYASHLLPLDKIAEMLREAGFVITTWLLQEGEGEGKRSHGCLLARKSE